MSAPSPSPDRIKSIREALAGVVDRLNPQDDGFQTSRGWMIRCRGLFDALATLDELLRRSDDDQPTGWPESVALAVVELPAALERVVGNRVGSWGLRPWGGPADLRWPDFGDIRYRPFMVDAEMKPAVDRLRSCLAVLEEAERTSDATAPPSNPAESPKAPAESRSAAMTPGARAVAAAYDLKQKGKPVSLRTVCEASGVDRANLRKNYPGETKIIKAMASPDRTPRRGFRDRRTGDVEAMDFGDDD
jgi:hypothetical protein